MKIKAIKTRLFKEGEDLIPFIISNIRRVPDGSIIVVTSKIVSLAQGRVVEIGSQKDKEKIIRQESQFAMKTKYVWLTIKDGMVLASAGIDESNANGKMILLPKDSFKTASELRRTLMKSYKVKNLGVIISDSRLLPLRAGAVGIVLGYAGFKGIRKYKGKRDLFNRTFIFERVDVADSLATSAVLLMGEGDERQPLALITEAPIEFTEKTNRRELAIDPKEDMYQPLFEKVKKIKF